MGSSLLAWRQMTRLKNALLLVAVIDHLGINYCHLEYILSYNFGCRMFGNALEITPVKERKQKLDSTEDEADYSALAKQEL